MSYHIGTALIWDNYKKGGECPLCEIYRQVELHVLDQFAGEAVMIPDFRVNVNQKGFCKKHFLMLAKSQNKLGIALQASTRMENIVIANAKNSKEAKKIAAQIESQLCTCVVCDAVQDSMRRYYLTIPKMFLKEKQFQEDFEKGKGHCLYHYAMLLDNCQCAGGQEYTFLQKLQQMQAIAMDRLQGELGWFCEKFDYRNKDKPMGTSCDALARCISKMHGEK